jgi:ribosome maturation factor RimP
MRNDSRPAPPRAARPAAAPRAVRSADAERLAGLLEPAVSAMDMDLEGVRVSSAGRRRLLRVTVDTDGGVSLDDIEKVSRELSAVLDRAAAMGDAPYTLEVSSPGVDRPLTEPRHWRRAIGRLVTAPVTGEQQPGEQQPYPNGGPAGPASVHGRVREADARGVLLDTDGGARRFSYGELGPGRIQIEFGRLDEGPGDGADEGTDEEEPDGY